MKYIFAGDRQIAIDVLKLLTDAEFYPEILLLSGHERSTHAQELIEQSGLSKDHIFRGKDFVQERVLALFKELKPTYIFSIHFPYIIPKEILSIPSSGSLNLHPAYLPYNKGWHTPSWSILEGTPIGATLHYMTEQLDVGYKTRTSDCRAR